MIEDNTFDVAMIEMEWILKWKNVIGYVRRDFSQKDEKEGQETINLNKLVGGISNFNYKYKIWRRAWHNTFQRLDSMLQHHKVKCHEYTIFNSIIIHMY
jgi:hypothetical protein